jgi:uncharacterized protein with PIN domain
MHSPQVKLLCDQMLGSLAKWLRLLGYDTLYPGPLGDREIAAKAHDEGRVLLTRDKDLAMRVPGAIFVASDDLDEQLKVVIDSLHLILSNPLSLCSLCNVSIIEVGRDEVRGAVPPKVLEIQNEFWKCPSCSRIYWRGSHWEDMLRRIKKLEGGLGSNADQTPHKD